MLKIDKIRKAQNPAFYVIDYLWGGFASLGAVCFFIAVWQVASEAYGPLILPEPATVFSKACEILKNFAANDLALSLKRALAGTFLALFAGICSGLAAGYFKSLRAFLNPLITVLLSTPPIVWIVLAIFWFHFGDTSVLFTVVIVVAPMTFASAAQAMASVSTEYTELFDSYKSSILKKLRYLYAPHLIERLLPAIYVAVSNGAKVLVMAELLGANDGIGAKIAEARVNIDTVEVMAYVCLVIAFTALFDYLVTKPLQILLMPWSR